MAGPAEGDRRPMRVDLVSIFPDMFEGVLAVSIPGRARKAGLIEWFSHDLRRYTHDRHNSVDDRPFGGGPGMVMMCQPIYDAVLDIESQDDRPAARLLMSPQGERLDQPLVDGLANESRLLILAGHYEGVDERVIEHLGFRELSIGDYVLSGGELPAMLVIDAIARLLPGALGHEQSAAEDSFAERTGPDGLPHRLLDCPHYTRPREWMGMPVPEVLTRGDHGAVDRWRHEQMIERTRARRPDLLGDTPDNTTNDDETNESEHNEPRAQARGQNHE
ncbi:MAG: tRNA (guanosine(37)-N1)-methyltransferase TrmD [Planctomycetota bacterium]